MTSDPTTPALSVIIPVLNEEGYIGDTLDALARMPGHFEVIVVDGGSRDRTVEIARSRRAVVITAERGRGSQMHAGAVMAQGEVLWFLHADTLPPVDAARRISEALADPQVIGGNFEVVFDRTDRPARFLKWLYPRLRCSGLCYGDSAFFVRRCTYEQVGGFRPYPIFEDLDLLRRIRRHGRFVHLPCAVVTSSRNFEGRWFPSVLARWVLLQVLFWSGIPPARLGRLDSMMRGPTRRSASDRQEARAGGGSPLG
jgi:rSAM/selenodomain-associated transferase 2